MPLIKLTASVPVPQEKQQELLPALSRILAETTRKPEQYVMITIESAAILMSAKPGPAAFADVRGIGGFTSEVNRQISKRVCALLSQTLGIAPDRVYLTFTDVPATNWGWNGETFG